MGLCALRFSNFRWCRLLWSAKKCGLGGVGCFDFCCFSYCPCARNTAQALHCLAFVQIFSSNALLCRKCGLAGLRALRLCTVCWSRLLQCACLLMWLRKSLLELETKIDTHASKNAQNFKTSPQHGRLLLGPTFPESGTRPGCRRTQTLAMPLKVEPCEMAVASTPSWQYSC